MGDVRDINHIRKHHGDKAAEKAADRDASAAKVREAIEASKQRSLPVVGDRYGRPLGIGDRVHYRPNVDVLCEVLDIVPNLDPRARAGSILVVFGATLQLTTPERSIMPAVTRIWTIAEVHEAEAEAAREAEKLNARAQAGTQAPAGSAPDGGPAIVLTDAEPPLPEAPPAQPAAPEPAAPAATEAPDGEPRIF